jgi:hypothetical protein
MELVLPRITEKMPIEPASATWDSDQSFAPPPAWSKILEIMVLVPSSVSPVSVSTIRPW